VQGGRERHIVAVPGNGKFSATHGIRLALSGALTRLLLCVALLYVSAISAAPVKDSYRALDMLGTPEHGNQQGMELCSAAQTGTTWHTGIPAASPLTMATLSCC
jgi:hypothetical protein